MTSLLLQADAVLRGNLSSLAAGRTGRTLGRLVLMLLVFGGFYGAVMGSFGGFAGDRVWQILFAAVKVPLLLVATFLIGLPNYFVLNSLLGLRRDFAQAVRTLVATQAGVAVVLASLAPLTAWWYASSNDYAAAVRFNLLIFATASLAAQMLLKKLYWPLIRNDSRHAWMLWIWLAIYAFVGIQMAWVLRPFVGNPEAPVRFFREDAWGNAYVIVTRLLLDQWPR